MNANSIVRTVVVLVVGLTFYASAQRRIQSIEPCPRDSSDFLRIQRLAEANRAEAQATMWDCYEQGQNVNPDGKKAIHWLSLSAQQGFVPAQYELGRTYLYGRGIPADYSQARLWEEKAALSGLLNAQRDIAFIYERGLGVTANPERAAFWNRKAAEQGDAQAQLHLAEALAHGSGIRKDSHEAGRWYRKAAAQGLPEAEMRVAEIEQQRQPQDCAAALTWYEKAARSGLTGAMLRLGAAYEEGKCVRVNLESAYTWFHIGERNGSSDCRAAAVKLADRLAPAQRARAELAAENWIRHNSTNAEEDDDEKKQKP